VSQPTPYERAYNFTNFQSTAPSSPLPAAHVDAEYNRVKLTLDQVLANLALLQRDDGALRNASVGFDQLSAAVRSGIPRATPWATARAYVVGDTVYQDGEVYYCATAHTSGVFATDLAAARWVSLGSPAGGIDSVFGRTGDVVATASDYDAVQVDFTPAGSLASTNLQDAIEELDALVVAALALKQALNANLTTIAGLTATDENVLQSASGSWASRTPTQLASRPAPTRATAPRRRRSRASGSRRSTCGYGSVGQFCLTI
jgi:hypothetical protein